MGSCPPGTQPGVAREPKPPQLADSRQEWRGTAPMALSQEWRGTTHHRRLRTPGSSGGLPQTKPSARSGEGPATTTKGGPEAGVAGKCTQGPHPGVTRDRAQHTPTTPTQTPTASPNQERQGRATKDHRHTTQTHACTPAHAKDTPTAHHHLHRHHKHTKHTKAQAPRATARATNTHSTGNVPPNPDETTHHPHRSRRTQARSGGEPQPGPSGRRGEGPLTTTNSGSPPRMAGSRTQDPQPGVARDHPQHTPATPTQTPAASASRERRGQATKDHRHTTRTHASTPAHAEDTPTPHHRHRHQNRHHKHTQKAKARASRTPARATYTHNTGNPLRT